MKLALASNLTPASSRGFFCAEAVAVMKGADHPFPTQRVHTNCAFSF